MRFDPQGWLVGSDGARVFRHPTRRIVPLVGPVLGAVWHWTAGYGSARTLARLAESGAGASFHIGIDRDGTVTQLAPITVGTSHCVGRWRGGAVINATSIGIELVNVGRVVRAGQSWFQVENPHEPPALHRPNPRVVVPPMDVVEAHGGHWQGYDPRQVTASERVLHALRVALPTLSDADVSHGHCDLDPKRKADPGPVWMCDILPGVVARTRHQA